MNPFTRLQDEDEGAPAALQRAFKFVLYGMVGYVAFLALNVAVASKGVTPGYDGLAYVNDALHVHLGWIGGQWNLLSRQAFDAQRWVGLPFTNTLDVLLLALIYKLVDYHVGVWLIHTAYVLAFVHFLRRVFALPIAVLVFLWAVSQAYFLQEYTQFISEMKVGMFLLLFVAFLFNTNAEKRNSSLFWVTILLLLLRTINILFVLPLAFVYCAMQWRRGARRGEIVASLMPVGWALLLMLPFLAHEIRYVFAYMYAASYTDMAQNWRDMARVGGSGKWGLFLTYAGNVVHYQGVLAIAAAALVAVGGALQFTRFAARLEPFRNFAAAALVVFAVLMQAQTTNIMLAFWIFLFLGVLAIMVLAALLKPVHIAVVACLLVLVGIQTNYASFTRLNRALANQAPTMELANAMAASIAGVEHPRVFQNFAGLGPLDFHGLEVASGRILLWQPVNNISYKTPVADYLDAMDSANVAFIANTNFAWPAYLGVNHETETLAGIVAGRAREMGLARARRLYYDSNDTSYIDVYLRPTVSVKLKYAQFDDYWLDSETPVVLEGTDPGQPLGGNALLLDVNVPSTGDPGFTLPMTASLVSSSGLVARVVSVTHVGLNRIVFPLDQLLPGKYQLRFDKTFTAKNDPRRLAAVFVGAEIRRQAAASAGDSR